MAHRAIWAVARHEKLRGRDKVVAWRKIVREMLRDTVTRAALERFLEILSEASRHVPEEWKTEHGPHIPWRAVADLGNRIRHAYHLVDPEVFSSIYEYDLEPVELAVTRCWRCTAPISRPRRNHE